MIQFLSLFSGIGAFEKALDRLGIEYNLVNYCEIDKYASKSYSAVHNVSELLNLGDITQVDTSELPHIDMISYGFPCQDISLAGKQQGLFNEDGTQTRSGLFFEALRIIEDTKPKVAIAENVKNLTSKKFKEQFTIVLDSLEQAGYNNYWQVLNAKDYGIPQNRERVFIVSIRKDIDNGLFKFPEPFELKLRLKDLLESEVDEKYYLSDKAINYVCATGTKNFYYKPEIDLEIARPLTSTMHKSYRASQDTYISDEFIKNDNKVDIVNGKPHITVKNNTDKCIQVADLNHYQNDQMNRVYSPDGIAPTQLVKSGGGRETKILVRENTKKGYTEAVVGDSVNFEQPNSKTRRGRVGKQVAQTLTTSPQIGVVIDDTQGFDGTRYYDNISPSLRANRSGLKTFVNGDICKTVRTGGHGSTDRHSRDMVECNNTLRIRKLTPLECWRLMGFDDEDFYKAEKVNSNTQLYKQAGNSIVVDVL